MNSAAAMHCQSERAAAPNPNAANAVSSSGAGFHHARNVRSPRTRPAQDAGFVLGNFRLTYVAKVTQVLAQTTAHPRPRRGGESDPAL